MKEFIILILLFFLNILVTKSKYRNLANPTILFNLVWIINVGLSLLMLFDLYETPDKTYSLIAWGVIFFIIGGNLSLLMENIRITTGKGGMSEHTIFTLNYHLLFALTVICIIYYLPQLFSSLNAIIRGISLNDVRGFLQDSDQSQGISNLLGNYIFLPLATALEPLAALDFWFGKRDKNFIISICLLVLIRSFGSGGRTPLFNLVFYFAISYCLKRVSMIYKKRKKVKTETNMTALRDKRMFKKLLGLGILGLVIMTLMRAAGSLIRKLYFYFAMSPVLLSKWLDVIDANSYHFNGLVSFNGIFYFIDYVRKNLFSTDYMPTIISAYSLIANTDSEWLKISSSGTTANAYVSCFAFFYADFGFYGVIILSLFFGFLASRLYSRVLYNFDLRSASLYMLISQSVFFSFIRFPFVKAYYVLAFLFLLCFAFKKTSVYKNGEDAFNETVN